MTRKTHMEFLPIALYTAPAEVVEVIDQVTAAVVETLERKFNRDIAKSTKDADACGHAVTLLQEGIARIILILVSGDDGGISRTQLVAANDPTHHEAPEVMQ